MSYKKPAPILMVREYTYRQAYRTHQLEAHRITDKEMDDPACLCTFKEQQSMCYIKEQAKFNTEQIQQTRLQTKQICTFITTKF